MKRCNASAEDEIKKSGNSFRVIRQKLNQAQEEATTDMLFCRTEEEDTDSITVAAPSDTEESSPAETNYADEIFDLLNKHRILSKNKGPFWKAIEKKDELASSNNICKDFGMY